MAPRKKKIEDDRKILRYPDATMQSALAAVREGRFKIREAHRHFGVPYSTLNNKVHGKVPETRKMGRDTYFTKSEEILLVKYIVGNAKKGIPIKRQTLIETVKKILDDDERVTPFNNNRPGRKWLNLFLKRHPEITERTAEGISTARAAVTAENITEWHKSLKEYLIGENASDILDDPQRIFNADESGFQTCPESGKVLGPVGMKNFYEVKSGKEKEQLTVMATINAAGQVISPMIVYPLVRISKEISANVPEDWAIGKSQKGWMTGPLYYEYIANVFDPWVKSNNIKKPVLLLIDGHRSHMTLQVSKYCTENQIIAYALFPNSTHISQPADVSLFKCMKSGWKKIVCEYKQNSGNRQVTRAGFAPLLAKVFKDMVTQEVVQNGFKRCGIYPFDVSAMDLSRCMDHDIRKTAPVSVGCEIGVETLLLLESFMRRGRTEQFRQSDEQWEGDESAKELFYVWKKFRKHCLSNSAAELVSDTEKSPKKDSENSLTPQRVQSPSILQARSAPNFCKADITPTIQQLQTKPSEKCPEPKIPPSHQMQNLQVFESKTPPSSPISTLKTPTKLLKSNTPTLLTPELQSPKPSSPIVALNTKIQSEHFVNTETNHIPAPTSSNNLVQIVAQKQKLISPAFGNHIIWPSDSPVKKRKTEHLPLATTSKKWQDYWSVKEREKEEKNKKAEQRKRLREEKIIKKGKPVRKKRVIRSDSELDEKSLSENENKKEENKKTEQKIRKKNKISKPVLMENFLRSDSELNEEYVPKNENKKERKQIREEKKVKKGEHVRDSELDEEWLSADEIEKCKNEKGTKNDEEKNHDFNSGDFVIFVYESSYFVGLIIDKVSQEGALIKSMQKSLNNWKWPEKEDVNLYSLSDIKEKIKEPQVINRKRGIYCVSEFDKYLDFV